ncbi:mannitol dehydrogenase family protein [Kordiimonas sp.]|uniref:mannitol dehydrogenase family protein n=1 Tax=Kordiimonas sp. TaxID=1970157 RepID=UPI003A8FE76A
MMRLNKHTLAELPRDVARPAYDIEAHAVGIVHLGIGAFHRGHQAVFFDDILARHGGDCRAVGVSLRSPAVREQLSPQDGLYTLAVMTDNRVQYRVVGSVAGVLTAPEDPEAVLSLMADESIGLITMTVTEKGYCHDPATGTLQEKSEAVQHDLAHPGAPTTAIGYLVWALKRRYEAQREAVTVMSCDNLPHNGQLARAVVLQFAGLVDAGLRDWIAKAVAFPCTMVDRIVPATTDADREAFASSTGVEDRGLVKSEPFSQWVIEDNFASAVPPFEVAGAMLVPDVAPYEDAKLRMLNGSHSALAYTGFLGGYTYIHEVVGNPHFYAFAERLMQDEAAPSLSSAVNFDMDVYRETVLGRYCNRALNHSTYQIAMDGSQKLPQRILAPLRANLKAGRPLDAYALTIAAWIRFVMGYDESGKRYEVQDPLAPRLKQIAVDAGEDPEALTRAFLSVKEIFATDLIQNDRVRTCVNNWLHSFLTHGVHATLEAFADAGDGHESPTYAAGRLV